MKKVNYPDECGYCFAQNNILGYCSMNCAASISAKDFPTLVLTKERIAMVLINTLPKITMNQVDLILVKLGFKL